MQALNACGNQLPTAPKNLQAFFSGNDVSLSWSASTDPDGFIEGYETRVDKSSWKTVKNNLTYTFVGIQTGKILEVRAKDDKGAYSKSKSTSFPDKNGNGSSGNNGIKPSVPIDLKASTTSTGITLTWKSGNDGATPTSYEVKAGSGAWEDVGTNLTHNFRFLASNKTYELYVRAKNGSLYSKSVNIKGNSQFNLAALSSTWRAAIQTNLTRESKTDISQLERFHYNCSAISGGCPGGGAKLTDLNAVKYMTNAIEIIVVANDISDIAADTFVGLTKMRTIALNGNKLTNIESGVFTPMIETLLSLQIHAQQAHTWTALQITNIRAQLAWRTQINFTTRSALRGTKS